MTDTVDGLLIVDKPSDWTSHDVVARARRLCNTRKVGHAGTLDPMATGLLVLGVGPATRLLTYVVGLDKTYAATIRLGVATDSDDADGVETARADAADDRVQGVGQQLHEPPRHAVAEQAHERIHQEHRQHQPRHQKHEDRTPRRERQSEHQHDFVREADRGG